MTQQQAHHRLRRIRDELLAARYALGRAEAKWDSELGTTTADFRGKLTLDEIRRAADNLDRTFLLRLFAEFEGILLAFWHDGLGRHTTPKVFVLINRIGDNRNVGDAHRDATHHVRQYRNTLVHAHAEQVAPLTIDQCLSGLGKFLAFLPQNW